MCAKVVIGFAHKIDFDARGEFAFEVLLHKGISREVDDVVDVDGKVQRRPSGNEATNEKTVFVCSLTKADGLKLFRDEMVPVSWRPAEAVKGLFEAPIGVGFRNRTPSRRSDDGRFVVWKLGMTKCILEVSLF